MNSNQRQLLIGTGNPGKQRELRALLGQLEARLVTPQDLFLDLHIREIGDDYKANAQIKAARYAQASGMMALSDDSGLEVEVLDGAPGLYSARVAGPDADDFDRREWLLEQLRGHPAPWRARFVCAAAVTSPSEVIATAVGTCEGEIAGEPRGDQGFGYDPLFVVEDTGKTMAELSEEKKNRVSHRARAIQGLLPALRDALSLEQ